MHQYFGAPNGSSRSHRRMVARSHPGDAGRPAEFGGLFGVGPGESAYRPVPRSGRDAAGARGAGGPAGSGQDHRCIALKAVSSHDQRRRSAASTVYPSAGLTVDPATSWYSLAVCKAMLVQSKSEITRCRPASPIALARSGSRASVLSASASAFGSSGGTSRPVSPSATTSGMPPTFEATTAVPHAIASRLTMPSGSYSDG